jgi:hypothetical protein
MKSSATKFAVALCLAEALRINDNSCGQDVSGGIRNKGPLMSSLDQDARSSEQSTSPLDESPSLLQRDVHPMIRLGQATFHRDLPELLKKHRQRWVAYHGDRRVAIGKSKRQLFQQCLSSGVPHSEFVVRFIEAETPDEIEWNGWRDV